MSPSNAFGFPVEHVPPQEKKPAETVGHFSATVTPPTAPDPTVAGDKAREKAGMNLSQLTWTFPDGTRRHAKLTSSRWAMSEALRQMMLPTGTTNYPRPLAEAVGTSQRFLTAPILLWFCLHEPEAWEEPRGKEMALMHDWQALYSEIRRWTDENIPPARLDDAVLLAETLADLTFSALPVRRASEDDPEPDEAQKKTQV
jgi:hypothetical protein